MILNRKKKQEINSAKLPRKSVLAGLDYLRRDNPWPEFEYEKVPSFYLSLDGGGRHLIKDLIRSTDAKLFLEIGSFLCGSTRQWLETSKMLTVIGVDPWDGNWAPYLEKRLSDPSFHKKMSKQLKDINVAIKTILSYGNFCVALNNIREYKDRFIPVRQRAPEVLLYLKKRKIHPDIIYLDAFKDEEDLITAYETFPNAKICGDDWNWKNSQGELQMRNAVLSFCKKKGFSFEVDANTWVLKKS